MAQAARLNLRMQKELKLLMTDPPPGVSLPLLSSEENLSSSSLSIIEAQIAGPEGTVYSKGIFNVKIQIPEWYPFQPPNVTLATPIYHPNIDNGGRICLDILNLPPKGAWQPSLNISTVLTSIGLLLSEPNPDDGLMAETSREYKYNKQAFDEKARSWTEKYATPGASKRINDIGILENPNLSQMLVDRSNAFMEKSTNENDGTRKKLRLMCDKLLVKPTAVIEHNCKADKDNVASKQQLLVSNCPPLSQHTMTNHKQLSHCETSERGLCGNHEQVEASLKFTETIIVSDSEESDDEGDRPLSSRLALRWMQIAGNQKNKQ